MVVVHTEQEEDSSKSLIRWFQTAIDEDTPNVAKLLATRGRMVAESDRESWSILQSAVDNQHSEVAVQLLVTCPNLHEHVHACRQTVLHNAARNGDSNAVTRLLSTGLKPGGAVDPSGRTALHRASIFGRTKVVASLLAANPELVSAVDSSGRTALHMAALNGHHTVVTQLLRVANVECVHAVDCYRQTALHVMFNSGFYCESLASSLLDEYPNLAHAVDDQGNTALHLAVASACSDGFIARLAELSPESLQVKSTDHGTPLQAAIVGELPQVIEIFQWKLTIDEIVHSFTTIKKNKKSFDMERLRPVIERQCLVLSLEALNQDVVQTVFEYLGFAVLKRATQKMTELEALAVSVL